VTNKVARDDEETMNPTIPQPGSAGHEKLNSWNGFHSHIAGHMHNLVRKTSVQKSG
jgi:hypothetical protein